MLVKVKEVGKGLHPSEVVVEVQGVEEAERLVVDRRAVVDGFLDVGNPVGKDNGYYLIELPRESIGGSWRLWVNRDVLVGEALVLCL